MMRILSKYLFTPLMERRAHGNNVFRCLKELERTQWLPKDELDKPRESPWGTTNREQKQGLEFGYDEYKEIDNYCKKRNIQWFASCWDTKSVDFFDDFDIPCFKIPSALLTHDDILKHNPHFL